MDNTNKNTPLFHNLGANKIKYLFYPKDISEVDVSEIFLRRCLMY